MPSTYWESERHWSFEHNDARSSDCRNVVGWIGDLLTFRRRCPAPADGPFCRSIPPQRAAWSELARLPLRVFELHYPPKLFHATFLWISSLGKRVIAASRTNPASRYVAVQTATRDTAPGRGMRTL